MSLAFGRLFITGLLALPLLSVGIFFSEPIWSLVAAFAVVVWIYQWDYRVPAAAALLAVFYSVVTQSLLQDEQGASDLLSYGFSLAGIAVSQMILHAYLKPPLPTNIAVNLESSEREDFEENEPVQSSLDQESEMATTHVKKTNEQHGTSKADGSANDPFTIEPQLISNARAIHIRSQINPKDQRPRSQKIQLRRSETGRVSVKIAHQKQQLPTPITYIQSENYEPKMLLSELLEEMCKQLSSIQVPSIRDLEASDKTAQPEKKQHISLISEPAQRTPIPVSQRVITENQKKILPSPTLKERMNQVAKAISRKKPFWLGRLEDALGKSFATDNQLLLPANATFASTGELYKPLKKRKTSVSIEENKTQMLHFNVVESSTTKTSSKLLVWHEV